MAAELEALAVRLGVASMWSREASGQSRGLMIGLLTQAGYPTREQQLALLGKLLQHTPLAAPYTSLTSRKAITQSVVSALIDWMRNPNTAKMSTIRWPATKALDALWAGKMTMPTIPMREEGYETTTAYTDLFEF